MLRGKRQFTLANFAVLADIVGMEIDGVIKQAIKEAHVLSIMEPNLDIAGMLDSSWTEFEKKKAKRRALSQSWCVYVRRHIAPTSIVVYCGRICNGCALFSGDNLAMEAVMTMQEDFTDFLDLEEFAVEVRAENPARTFAAIFDNPGVFATLGSLELETTGPVLTCKHSDVADFTRETVCTVGGRVYDVDRVEPDGTGVAVVLLFA
jgi:hypothetical protein